MIFASGISGSGRRPGDVTYVLEPKVDGVAVGVAVREGRADRSSRPAATVRRATTSPRMERRWHPAVPMTLHARDAPEVLEVRGEIYMPSESFQQLNETEEQVFNDKRAKLQADADAAEQEKAGKLRERIEKMVFEPFMNPRNATAGTLKQRDPKIVAERSLRFVAHGLGEVVGLELTSFRRDARSLAATSASRRIRTRRPPPDADDGTAKIDHFGSNGSHDA